MADLKALSELLAKRKEQLEATKQSLIRQRDEKDQPGPPTKKLKEETAIPIKQEKKERASGVLVLDEKGRELDEDGNVKTGPIMPRHATTLANQRKSVACPKFPGAHILRQTAPANVAPKAEKVKYNPYLQVDQKPIKAAKRKQREFNWVEPGSIVNLGDEMRAEIKIEDEESKMAEDEFRSKEALLLQQREIESDAGIHEAERKAFIGKAYDMEWWDVPFVQGPTAEGSTTPGKPLNYGKKGEPIPMELSKINSLIIHPIPIQPPAEAPLPAPRPLPMTRAEQKKSTKQTRAANRTEAQEKILLGQEEAPKARVRLANMYRVYGTEAMMDPTRIETLVTSETEERLERHNARNAERKLTPQQRKEKKQLKLVSDTALAITVCLFKIVELNPKNRFKIDVNAQQLYLTGACLMGPHFTMVIVEGGPKALRRYKKLLTERIQWNRNADQGSQEEEDEDEEKPETKPDPDAKENRCDLVWEGEILQRNFNDFQIKTSRTEAAARKFLTDKGCAHYLEMARDFVPGK